ncbi:ribosomal protein S18-alanine N-acetyltransferase [Actinomycetospora cinnamomea]|uniref:Ribosomal-protein-alanine N-acetyltransferase n=1 Tax=Actinomycetospora cinnamomea TaxID=663609 RepID=A0A2U1F7D5_9PSEU|nr:ribosomal protein S18-alanine N-acetyltransferase [Actinomycetospora cinnamomea]PVZ07880.1 ribosomal-protein-alanine N-acetyltransferase [Actinomycetospora cinnamomea]
MTVVLDALTPDDAERCAELEAILFPGDDPWSARAFREELRAGHRYLAARERGEDAERWVLVGYGGVALLPGRLGQPAEAEIHTIGVDPTHQGRGTGRALLAGLLAAADAIGATTYLEVRTDNEAALHLYRSAGFEVLGTRRRYYASGADAYTMRRLPPGDTPRSAQAPDPR